MSTSIMPEPRQRYYTNSGTPAAGCLLYTFAAGTTTPKAAYTDPAGLVPHTNPIVLDAKGECLAYFSGNYKIDLKTAAGVQITGYPVDNYVADAAGTLRADLAAPSGAGLSGFSHVETYPAATLGAKAGQVKSPTDAPYSAAGDGAANDTAALDAWLTDLCANGGSGHVPGGTYSLASGVTALLSASASITVSATAKFVAAAGFPAGQKMFLITTGAGSGHVFEWEGGRFDATNQPNSGAGEANDIFYFSAENCTRCNISLDKTTAGADWLNSGSDSHLFIGGASNVHAYIGHCIGAKDAGIYISSNADGSIGQSLHAGGNFEKCQVAIIVKRLFDVVTIDANVIDCANGVAGGESSGATAALLRPGDGYQVRVNALRTERPCSLIAVNGGIIEVQAKEMGVSIPGYASTTAAYAAYLSGSTGITGTVTVQGTNPACTPTAAFNAVKAERRTLDATNYDATDNYLTVNCSGIGKGISEDATSARNHYTLKERSCLTNSFISGTDSTLIRMNLSASSYEVDASTVSLGGTRSAEALRVNRIASQVNFLNVSGAATGGRPSIGAAGTDADIDLQLAAKGTGLLRFGSHAASADAPVSGYISIRDLAGTTRKLAVIS